MSQRNFQDARKASDGKGMKEANTLWASFSYALQGLRACLGERNFRVHCVAAVVAFLLCIALSVPAWGWTAVIICIGMVMAAEAVNTAVESVVDLASPELHPLAKRAKDCAAGAVLILAFISLFVAGVVFAPPVFALLGFA